MNLILYKIIDAYAKYIDIDIDGYRLTAQKIKNFVEELDIEEWKLTEDYNTGTATLYLKNVEFYFCDIIQGLLQYHITFGCIIKVTNTPID